MDSGLSGSGGGGPYLSAPPQMKDSGSLVTGADKLYKVYTHVVDTIKRVEMPEWEKLMNTLHPKTSVSPQLNSAQSWVNAK